MQYDEWATKLKWIWKSAYLSYFSVAYPITLDQSNWVTIRAFNDSIVVILLIDSSRL